MNCSKVSSVRRCSCPSCQGRGWLFHGAGLCWYLLDYRENPLPFFNQENISSSSAESTQDNNLLYLSAGAVASQRGAPSTSACSPSLLIPTTVFLHARVDQAPVLQLHFVQQRGDIFFPLLLALMKSQVIFRWPVISVICSSVLISRSLNLLKDLARFGVDVVFPRRGSQGLISPALRDSSSHTPQALVPDFPDSFYPKQLFCLYLWF